MMKTTMIRTLEETGVVPGRGRRLHPRRHRYQDSHFRPTTTVIILMLSMIAIMVVIIAFVSSGA